MSWWMVIIVGASAIVSYKVTGWLLDRWWKR
jgi:hypothetical protein